MYKMCVNVFIIVSKQLHNLFSHIICFIKSRKQFLNQIDRKKNNCLVHSSNFSKLGTNSYYTKSTTINTIMMVVQWTPQIYSSY